MKAVTWHGRRDVRVEEVPDPIIKEPTDAIVQITSTGLCGSDLHLYEMLGPFMGEGDILGHEPMGIVEEVGAEVGDLQVGDRVVIPFQICCGHCWMCEQGLHTQCETTQVRDQGMGAALFGFSKLYGEVPGGQAEFLRVPQAQFMPIKVPEGPPDERFLFLSDVLPTAWQAVAYADVPDGRHAAGARARPDRRHGLPDRHAPGLSASSASTWCPSGWRGRAAAACEVIDLDAGRRPRRGGPDAHRRPRCRLGHRRGRHGGARLARRRGRAADRQRAAEARSPRR